MILIQLSPLDWAIDRLHRFGPLVGYRRKGYDDTLDRIALEGAFNLETWLMIEAEAYAKIGEDCPTCVDDASIALHELMPLIAQYMRQPGKRGGPTPDNRRWLDALRDIEEQSDFSQADDCGRRTIEKLEERLGEMQPEEEGKEAA